jgi:MFS family permease
LRAATYSGAILGFLIVSFFSDNFGRKISLVLAWGICVIGSLLVTFGYETTIIGIGLFLSGFGSDAAINITYLYFC